VFELILLQVYESLFTSQQLQYGFKQEGQYPLTGQRTANFRLLANQ